MRYFRWVATVVVLTAIWLRPCCASAKCEGLGDADRARQDVLSGSYKGSTVVVTYGVYHKIRGTLVAESQLRQIQQLRNIATRAKGLFESLPGNNAGDGLGALIINFRQCTVHKKMANDRDVRLHPVPGWTGGAVISLAELVHDFAENYYGLRGAIDALNRGVSVQKAIEMVRYQLHDPFGSLQDRPSLLLALEGLALRRRDELAQVKEEDQGSYLAIVDIKNNSGTLRSLERVARTPERWKQRENALMERRTPRALVK